MNFQHFLFVSKKLLKNILFDQKIAFYTLGYLLATGLLFYGINPFIILTGLFFLGLWDLWFLPWREPQTPFWSPSPSQPLRLLAHDMRNRLGLLKAAFYVCPNKPERAKNLFKNGFSDIETMVSEMETQNCHIRVKKKFVKLKPFCQSLERELLLLLKSSPIELSISHNIPNSSIQSFMDQSLVKRAFMNVVKNAQEAIKEQNGQLRIEFTMDSTFTIGVLDNGPGLPPLVLKNLGQKVLPTQKPQGRGLGLYQAFQTMLLHGGTLKVKSQKNQGAFFQFVFSKKDILSPPRNQIL